MRKQQQPDRSRRRARPLAVEILEGRCLPSTYTLTDLGSLDGRSAEAYGVNDAGQVVGVSSSGAGSRAFLFQGGGLTDLGVLPGGTFSAANAINNAGQAAGYSSSSAGIRPVLFQDGKLTDLGSLGGRIGSATAINNGGQVAGGSYTPNSVHAFRWEDGVMTDLGALPGGVSSATGINDAGQVVGTSAADGQFYHAFRTAPNSPINPLTDDLGTLPGDVDSQANGINSLGHFVGWSGDINYSRFQAFYYDGSTLNAVGPDGSVASGINDSDRVVGSMPVALHVYHAFLYADGVVTDLNDVIPPDSGLTLEAATAINNAGQIVGFTFTGGVHPQPHAFLLTPDGGGPLRAVNPAVFRLTVAAPVAATVGGITNQAPANAPREQAAVATLASMPAGAAARQVTDAVFAGSHRAGPPAQPGGWEVGGLELGLFPVPPV
jgi:probable HAF family extracellular repeat protein